MHRVDLYVAHGEAALQQLAAAAELLDAEERAKAARLVQPEHRRIYRAAHVLLRRVLSRHASVAPEQWSFRRSGHGRPEIDSDAHPRAAGLRFNLSHTHRLVCCAVAWELPVGVDAECERAMRDRLRLAARFFAASESAAVAAAGRAGESAEHVLFYALWTLKEAYVKSLGRGLALGLDRFAFGFDRLDLAGGQPAAINLQAHHPTDHADADWRCAVLHLDQAGCTIALVVPAPPGVRVQVHLYGPSDAADEPPCPRAVTPLVDWLPPGVFS